MGFQISHKLLALGLGGVITTAAVLVGVGAWQSDEFADKTNAQVSRLNAEDLDQTTANVARLAKSVGDEVQNGVDDVVALLGGGLTVALSRLAMRDLTVSVPPNGQDESGRAGTALNTAVAELREVIVEVAGASDGVTRSAGQVATTGSELTASAHDASGQAGAASTAAEGISHVVQTVAAGAEEMGASIGEISSNAQEAARAGRDGVGLTETATTVIGELRLSTTKIADVVRLFAGIAERRAPRSRQTPAKDRGRG